MKLLNWFLELKITGFFKSIYILLFNTIKRPALFHGYQMKWFARQYGAKREVFWHKEWNQMGREQFIMPFLKGRLLVCSKLELEIYKKKGLINKNLSIRKLTKKSL